MKKDKEQVAKEKQELRKLRSADKNARTILTAFPVRDYREYGQGEGYFLMENGTIMDLFQIKGKSYLNASDEETEAMVTANTYFYRRYSEDFKIIPMNYPANTRGQQQFLQDKIEKTPDGVSGEIIKAKLKKLQWLEQNTTCRQAFFVLFAESETQYETLRDLLFQRSRLCPAVISREKKEHILWQLNNMCKQIKL